MYILINKQSFNIMIVKSNICFLVKVKMKGREDLFMMRTRTSEAKQLIVRLLKEGSPKSYSVPQIRDYLEQNASRYMSDGVIAGALYALTQDPNSGIVKRGRGQYAYDPDYIGSSKDNKLTPQIIQIINNAIKEIKVKANDINPLEIEEEDVAVLKKIKNLVKTLERTKVELEEHLLEK